MSTLLVSGASGQLGQLVLKSLLKNKTQKIIATTREPEKLKDFAHQGVDVRQADFSNADGLVKAFAGADRLLLISTDAVGSRTQQHVNAIEAAKKAGVKHIIYTSLPNPDRSPAAVAPEHKETEIALAKSGLTYTILRNNLYTNYLLPSFQHAVATGSLYGSRKGSRIAYVTREDCAEAAVHALLSNEYVNAIYDVAGKESLNLDDLAKIFSKVSGKSLMAIDVSLTDFQQGLIAGGMNETYAGLFASFETAIAEGTLAAVGQGEETVEGFLTNFQKQ